MDTKNAKEKIGEYFCILFDAYCLEKGDSEDRLEICRNALNNLNRYTDEMSIDQLTVAASYWRDIFDDYACASRLLCLAAIRKKNELAQKYRLTMGMADAYLMAFFPFLLECNLLEGRSTALQDSFFSNNTLESLAHTFDFILYANERLETLPEKGDDPLKKYEDDYYWAWDILKLLLAYCGPESNMYISRLEKLLEIRLRYMNLPPQKITDYTLDDEEYLFNNLGMWYTRKRSIEDKEKGFKYLMTSLSDTAIKFDPELCNRTVKRILLLADKYQYVNNEMFGKLADIMERCNERHGEGFFSDKMVSIAKKKAVEQG